MDVGFIGLGSMGRGMARNLIKAGHRLSVYNRSKGPADELARDGALKAGSPAAVGGEIVVTMLADDAAVEAVVLGTGGLTTGMRRGAVHLSMSTISVALSDRLEEAHRNAGQAPAPKPLPYGRGSVQLRRRQASPAILRLPWIFLPPPRPSVFSFSL